MTVFRLDASFIDDMLKIENDSFSMPWTRLMFEAEFKKDFAFYVGVLDGGKLIAYGGFWKILDEGHITNIAVCPDYRRQGAGKLIVEEMKRICGKVGILRMTLEVRESNKAAIALYERCGFVTAGRRKAYYEDNGEDALLMWLEL